MPTAVKQPAKRSETATPTFIGPLSGVPVIAMMPAPACASRSKPGAEASGPARPKPVIEAVTRRGFSWRSFASDSPNFSRPPGGKFSTSTSARAASKRTDSAPSGAPRSRARDSLLRLMER